MQRDIQPNEIDWVFCWRTNTGDVRRGRRDTKMNGRPVAYRPDAVRPEAGLRTIVRGRERTCPHPPTGPHLNEQGSISRMAAFVWGHVCHALLVPARTMRELEVLQGAARAAVRSGDNEAIEWALAAIHARDGLRWAIHVDAPRAFVSTLARLVDAPWTLDVREKEVGSWFQGAQILCLDREGGTIETLEADSIFDAAPLPPFALPASANGSGEQEANFDRIIRDPERVKQEMFEEWKKEHPNGTDEEWENAWGPCAGIFGL